MTDSTLTIELPNPDGTRGSGAPWWRVGTPGEGGTVSPVESYNLPDTDVPCVALGVRSGLWPVGEARELAAAILAAVAAAEQEASDA